MEQKKFELQRTEMNLNMRFPLSKSCQTTLKLLRHVFYIMYHKNYYQAYWKVHFLIFQPTLMVNHYPQDGHPPSHGWSLTIQNLPEGIVLQACNLASRLNSQNQDQVTTVMDGQSPSPGWSPTIQRMVTNHPKSNRRKCTTDLEFGT